MKIAFLGQEGVPAVWGGVEEHVDHLSRALVRSGLQVEVYVRNWYTPREMKAYAGLTLVHVPTLRTKHLDAAVHTLLGTLRALSRGTDVFHYQAIGPGVFCLLPRLLGKRTVVTVHARDWEAGKWGPLARAILKACEKYTVRFAHRTVVLSEEMRAEIRTRYGVEALLIPHGLMPLVRRPARLIRERWGLEPGRFALFLGRLVPEKRADWLITAFRELRESVPAAAGQKLVIAGGSSATDDHVRRLKALAGGDPDIIFTGMVRGEAKEELLSQAGLFLLPSRLEGYPIALLEARGYGLCCLASDIPPHREIIRDGVDGRLFSNGDQAALKTRWAELLARPDVRAALGNRAARAAAGGLTWDQAAARTRSLYEALFRKD